MNEKESDKSKKLIMNDEPYIDHELREEFDNIMETVDHLLDEKHTKHETRNAVVAHPIVQFLLLPFRIYGWLSTGLKF